MTSEKSYVTTKSRARFRSSQRSKVDRRLAVIYYSAEVILKVKSYWFEKRSLVLLLRGIVFSEVGVSSLIYSVECSNVQKSLSIWEVVQGQHAKLHSYKT